MLLDTVTLSICSLFDTMVLALYLRVKRVSLDIVALAIHCFIQYCSILAHCKESVDKESVDTVALAMSSLFYTMVVALKIIVKTVTLAISSLFYTAVLALYLSVKIASPDAVA